MKYRVFCVLFTLSLLLSLIFPSSSHAATYYVSPSGSDSNTAAQATSLSTPWKTIQKAVNAASAGDTVVVKGGTYSEAVAIAKGGSATARLTIAAAQGETPVIDGSSLSSITTDGLVQIKDNINYVTFNGFTVKKSPNMGIANRGSNNIISNNKVLLAYDTAIWHRIGSNTVFTGNEVYFNQRMNSTSSSDTGITCSSSTTWWPAALNSQKDEGTGTVWKNNIVHNNCGEGVVANKHDQIIGNTFYDNWSINIYLDEATDVIVDGNLVYETEATYIPRGSNNSYKNLAAGLYVSDETACIARDNTFTNNIVINTRFGFGFYPYSSCSGVINTKLINNTFINSWDYALRFSGSSSANSGSIVANNLIYSKHGKALLLENPLDFKFYNNLWYFVGGDSTGQFQWGATAYNFNNWQALNASALSNNYWIDPQIVGSITPAGYVASQYHLKDTSPAINSGLKTGITGLPTTDYLGKTRLVGSSIDIGAVEYAGGTTVVIKPGDLNTDGSVNLLDFNLLITNFGSPYTILDFNNILTNFGK